MKKIIFTTEGLNNLLNELKTLEESRPYLINELRKASELGDRSENEAYKAAKSKLRYTDTRIVYLNKIKLYVTVVTPTQFEKVAIGHTVKILKNDKEYIYRIVGSHEADPAKGKISYLSPIGAALINRRVQEKFMFEINGNKTALMIKDIST